jgi:hypothetical protein
MKKKLLPNPPGYKPEPARTLKTFDDLLNVHRDEIQNHKARDTKFDHSNIDNIVNIAHQLKIRIPGKHPFLKRTKGKDGRAKYVYLGEW